MTRAIRLLEYAVSPDLRVDEENGIIRGVRVIGPQSANNREYLKEALATAAPLYCGKHVYIDHREDSRKARGSERKFGWLEDVKPAADGGLQGNLHYLKSHPMAARVIEAARRRPDLFGLSHDALGRARPGSSDRVIEAIDKVQSVDLVDSPATVHSLFESKQHLLSKRQSMSQTQTLREVLAGKVRDESWKTWLLEMDYDGPLDQPLSDVPGAQGLDPEPEAEPAVPAHGEELFAAVADLIDAALDGTDESALDGKYLKRLNKIKALCEEDMDNENEETHEEESDEMPEEPVEKREGQQAGKPGKGQLALQEQVKLLERKEHVRELCADEGYAPSATELTALVALSTDEDIKSLVESLQAAQTARVGQSATGKKGPRSAARGGSVVPPTTSKRLTEGAAPKDAKDFLKKIEARARA